MDFGSVITAMATPLNADLSLDYNGAQKLADHLLKNGSDSLVVCGTTGESPTLSKDEKLKLFAAIHEVTKGKASLIAGTSSYDTGASVELTKKAEAVGVDAILAVTPYYNKPPQEGLYAHYAAIAGATRLPVILYNVPPRTNVNLEADTVARLAKIDNVVAVKEASGSLDQASIIRTLVDDDFLLYSGDDSLTLPLMSIGACGIISVASHLIGNQIKEMVQAFKQGNLAKAQQLHVQYFQVFRKLFICTSPIPLKYCLNKVGLPAGPARLPLVEASDEHKAILDKMLQEIGLI